MLILKGKPGKGLGSRLEATSCFGLASTEGKIGMRNTGPRNKEAQDIAV